MMRQGAAPASESAPPDAEGQRAAPPGRTPNAELPLRVLYLFAGVKRQADIGGALKSMVHAWNSKNPHQRIALRLHEVDTLRGGDDHNLTKKELKTSLLRSIREGEWDVVIVAPPCNTYSRATFAGGEGPTPRSRSSVARRLPMAGAAAAGGCRRGRLAGPLWSGRG